MKNQIGGYLQGKRSKRWKVPASGMYGGSIHGNMAERMGLEPARSHRNEGSEA